MLYNVHVGVRATHCHTKEIKPVLAWLFIIRAKWTATRYIIFPNLMGLEKKCSRCEDWLNSADRNVVTDKSFNSGISTVKTTNIV